MKDPVSVQRGVGPVCHARLQAEKEERQDDLIPPKSHEPVTMEDLPKSSRGKFYEGYRDGGNTVIVTDDYIPLRHIPYHSPTGMEFGYGGSGPADLARSILWDLAGQKVADTFYQQFKREFIAVQPRDSFMITGENIFNWLVKKVKGGGEK